MKNKNKLFDKTILSEKCLELIKTNLKVKSVEYKGLFMGNYFVYVEFYNSDPCWYGALDEESALSYIKYFNGKLNNQNYQLTLF